MDKEVARKFVMPQIGIRWVILSTLFQKYARVISRWCRLLRWREALQFLEPVLHNDDFARGGRVRSADHHETAVRENVV